MPKELRKIGVIAGGPARAVIESCRYQEHPYQPYKSPGNKQNVVLGTIEGLRQLKTPEEVAQLHGKG